MMQPDNLERISIIGAGTMGVKIAFRCVIAGYQVYLYDKYDQALNAAPSRIEEIYQEWKDKGKETENSLKNLILCQTLPECVQNADFVIESVPENLELKRQIFSEIDKYAPANAYLATHSSSLPASKIADVTQRPEKVFNINFSDPTGDPLVEIMASTSADPAVLIVGEEFVRSLDMVPIIVRKEIMGFAFNRIWRIIKRESLYLIADGYADFEDIDRAWMLSFGGDMGPFGIMDEIGLDVVRDIENQYFLDSGDPRDKPPQLLDRLIKENRLGVKSGKGFYTYPNPEYQKPGWLLKKLPWTVNDSIQLEE
jgi:3-hydroxybutyryl-CoA dehydrogenase